MRHRLGFLFFSIVAAVSALPVGQTPSAATLQASDQHLKMPPGSYQFTCVAIAASEKNLQAMCQTVNGEWLTTEFRNPYSCSAGIYNGNGRLACDEIRPVPPGKYFQTCKEVSVVKDTLRGKCTTHEGTWLATSLKDFYKCGGDIENVDGSLQCQFETAVSPDLEALRQAGRRLSDRLSDELPVPPPNSQLVHDRWTFKDGAPEQVLALAQTTDGFLWLGSSSGLFRFDGVRFEPFKSPFGDQLLSTNTYTLFVPASGGLWIGYSFGGFSFVRDGRVTNYPADSGTIWQFAQGRDGTLWAGTTSGLWKFENSAWKHLGAEWNVPIQNVISVKFDQDDNLWVGGDGMLLCLRRGNRQFQIVEKNLYVVRQQFNTIRRIVDREGNIWFASPVGVDRFYYSPLVRQELPAKGQYLAVSAGDEGQVWLGSYAYAPIYRITGGQVEAPKKSWWSVSFAYRAPDNTLWIGAKTGLWHETVFRRFAVGENYNWFNARKALWEFSGHNWVQVKEPPGVAAQDQYLQAITQDHDGGMWISFGRHGLYRLANSVWTPYGGRNDLPKTGVVCEFTDNLGRVWFGYLKNTLAMLDRDRVQVFGSGDGVRVGNITAIYGRGAGIWIGGEFGLQQYDGGRFHNIKATDDELLRGISGIVETANGDLWLNAVSGIFHVTKEELSAALKSPRYQVKGERFGRRQGFPGLPNQMRPLPTAVEGTDGRLWFTGGGGLVWLDPARVQRKAAPAQVTIQSVSASGKSYLPGFPLRFPAHTADVQIGFAAVNLSDPEGIHFRYKLEETDQDWHEVATASPVTYRDLPPSRYHFRVNATDTNGVWSDKVATAEFTILPAYYQTLWFRLSCVGAFLLLLAALYRLRLHQLRKQYNISLEARVSERMRIARDLHDTLLQSFQGVLLKFEVAGDMLKDEDSDARKLLVRTTAQARKAITEGRDAVYGLRASTDVTNELARAIRTLGEELAAVPSDGNCSDFHVLVEGASKDIVPIIRDEVYRIASESVRNAFKHAHARRIEVELCYDPRKFRLRVSDNGRGIDPKILAEGGARGHYGLPGMQERARLVKGKLSVQSTPDSGTEIELSIPASVAYTKSHTADPPVSSGKGA